MAYYDITIQWISKSQSLWTKTCEEDKYGEIQG